MNSPLEKREVRLRGLRPLVAVDGDARRAGMGPRVRVKPRRVSSANPDGA